MRRDLFAGIIVPLSILVPIGIFIPRYKYATKEMKIIFYYLIMVALVSLISIVMKNQSINNLPLLHIYTILETFFLLYYFKVIFDDKKIKKMLEISIVAFPVLCVVNFSFFQSIYTFNTYTRPLEAILITIFCLVYFYKSGFIEDWIKKPINWVNIGVMIYFPAATIIFVLSNYFVFVTSNRPMNKIIWDIHSFLVLAMYLAFARGFSLLDKKNNA